MIVFFGGFKYKMYLCIDARACDAKQKPNWNINFYPITMKKILFTLIGFMASAVSILGADLTDVTVVDNLETYLGSGAFVYNCADGKVYALNNLGQYEEYGIIERVTSLDVAKDKDIKYIETTAEMNSRPYINTGYVFKAETRIIMDYETNAYLHSYEAPFGARLNSFKNNAFVFFSRFNNHNLGNYNRSGVETNGSAELEVGQRYTVDAQGQTCNIYKHGAKSPYQTIVTDGTADDGINPMFIFDLNTAGQGGNRRDNSYTVMKLYGFKIYEGEKLVMDLQPILSTKGVPGLRDKVSGKHFYSETSEAFGASPDAGSYEAQGLTVYEGKIVNNTADGKAYEWTNGAWVALGVMSILLEDEDYKNMNNWVYPEEKADCFADLTYDNVNDKNHLNYIGGPNHEPFFCQFPTEAGQNYQVTFTFGCDAWDTWNSDRSNLNNYMRAVVLNRAYASTNFTENGNTLGGQNGVLARYQLPREETVGHQVVMNFTAEEDHEFLLLQFGNVEDDVYRSFDFDRIRIFKIVSVKQYSYTPYLAGLIKLVENTDITTSTSLQKALNTALSNAKSLLKSSDTDAQKAAYEALLKAFRDARDFTAVPGKGDLVINEFMPANPDLYMSPAKNFDSWIELYNVTDQPYSLAGCYLSDDAANPTKWRLPKTIGKIPANGHFVIWLGSNDILQEQGPFKLECEGGEIILSNPDGKIISQETYPEAVIRCSFARKTDGGADWSWTGTPTLAASNNTSSFASRQLDAPVVSPDGKLFNGLVNITVNIPSGATLRYTTDGTTPTLDNGQTSTTGLFTCESTQTYRFRLFRNNYLPSEVTSRTYIVKDNLYTLPIISVATKGDYLWDDQIGVYTKGSGGKTGNGQSTPANWNMPWDRPVYFQYILPETNEMVVSQECDFKISGGWTRANYPKAFKLKADRKFDGRNAFDYQFFDMKPFNKNKTLQVRAGGNDSGSRIKDAAIQNIIQRSGINLDVISYQPAVHFINGNYMGLINVREPNNKDYAFANFGLSKDEIEVFEQSPDSGRYMMIGTMETLNRLDELSETPNDPAAYEEIKQLLDIDEYINYMAAELYLGSWDWPDNNVKGYRKLDNGKYRIVMFDVDAAFETDGRATGENGTYLGGNFFRWIDDMQWHTFDYIYDTGQRMYGEQKFCTFFLNMLQNDDFRKRLIDSFCIMGGSVFDEQRANDILTELGNRVRTTMSWEGRSPDGSLNSIKSHLAGRKDTKVQHMVDYERLELTSDQVRQVTITSDLEQAKLRVNNMEIPYGQFNGYLFAPSKITAEAPSGYKFTGWKKASTTTKTIIPEGSYWKYYDQGSLDGQQWYSNGFNDESWGLGNAPLGYGKEVATTLDYGGNAQNKYPTYYLRTTVPLSSAPTSSAVVILNYIADDGFIIYVNGQEAGRYNMPSGDVTFDMFSTTDAKSNPDRGSLKLDPTLFKSGSNLIAVEVHNFSRGSSDVMWEANITLSATSASNNVYSTEQTIELPEEKVMNLQATFKALTKSEQLRQAYSPISINEVSGANSIFMNEYFKRNDWVELYNSTDEDFDAEGMYLSDDATNPKKWQITKEGTRASTIIPAHGFLVIWCDKLETDTQLHAPFKIDADGGIVMITAKDQSWKNVITYDAHNGDESIIRYPDGSDNVYLSNFPTIEKTNIFTSYLTSVEQKPIITDGIRPQAYVSDNNGLKIRYAAGRVIVRSEQAGPATVTIYTLAGQQLLDQPVTLRTDRVEVDVTALPAGTYMAKVTDSEGNTASTKFIK